MTGAATHVGFADESHWNKGRFRDLALITASCDRASTLDSQLRLLLEQSGVREFKWNQLEGAKERFAAEKLCKFAVEKACAGQLRVDVLIWDTEDNRHRIRNRDDIANLERMYYHLFRNVLRARWPDDAIWRLHPDEHSALNWETVQSCLEAKSVTVEAECSLLAAETLVVRLRREFSIEVIRPISSGEHPLLQLADLFAGMAVFSRNHFDDYQKWLREQSGQPPLFDEAEASSMPSGRSCERFRVLQQFDRDCKQNRLGVSLTADRGLRTHDPRRPINFWMYTPQHPQDKAPRKDTRRAGL